MVMLGVTVEEESRGKVAGYRPRKMPFVALPNTLSVAEEPGFSQPRSWPCTNPHASSELLDTPYRVRLSVGTR